MTEPKYREGILGFAWKTREPPAAGEKPTYSFTAATEAGVRMPFEDGPEHLDMDGARLHRFDPKSNPVLLDTHNRRSVGNILGRVTRCGVDFDRSLGCDVMFADTPLAREAESLVRGNFIRGVSIGYVPLRFERVEPGASTRLGQADIRGPASIVREWELYELSLVPVPADSGALRREIVCRAMGETKGAAMAEENKPDEKLFNLIPASGSATVTTPAVDIRMDPEDPSDPITLVKRRVMSIAPRDLSVYAEGLFLDDPDITFEAARAKLREEYAKRLKPAGTPEPQREAVPPKTRAFTDEEILRSLTR